MNIVFFVMAILCGGFSAWQFVTSEEGRVWNFFMAILNVWLAVVYGTAIISHM